MSDLELLIKALRDTAGDLYRYSDSLKDAGADALETLARNLEEAVRQRLIDRHRQEPIILGCPSGCTSPFCDCPGTR